MAADIVAQLPQLEAMASVLYNSQVGAPPRAAHVRHPPAATPLSGLHSQLEL